MHFIKYDNQQYYIVVGYTIRWQNTTKRKKIIIVFRHLNI
jgi:hypothetical protein